MVYDSLIFLAFFPATVLIYYLLPNLKLRNLFLLFASYYFYMNWNPRYAILIAIVTCVTFVFSIFLEKNKCPKKRKLITISGIIIVLTQLFIYKYLGFASTIISESLHAFGLAIHIPQFNFLLPVGISFYSFQAIGYLIDVYKRNIQAERSIITYALFISFFPQLVAGPIERAKIFFLNSK